MACFPLNVISTVSLPHHKLVGIERIILRALFSGDWTEGRGSFGLKPRLCLQTRIALSQIFLARTCRSNSFLRKGKNCNFIPEQNGIKQMEFIS